MSKFPLKLAALLGSILLSGCASREVLVAPPADSPQAVSFEGLWQLRGDRRLIDARLQKAIRQTDGVRDGDMRRPPTRRSDIQRRSDGRISGGLVYVFFENGSQLKISQTDHALFVSFDRAIVEEYRFGENRTIQVGQAEAQRVSGWEGADYVIETLDRNGMKLTERYQLSADGEMLTRRITFRGKDKQDATVTQLFARS